MKPYLIVLFLLFSLAAFSQHTDEILSWEEQYSGTYNILLSVDFINTQEGWAAGGNGTILHTMDGGVEWAPQESGTHNTLYKVVFLDEDQGWACGLNGTIIATNDGGQNWIAQESGTMEDITTIEFSDPLNGWACTNKNAWPYWANIIHTSDGGTTWELQDTPIDFYECFRGLFFVDELNGFAGGIYNKLMKTNNGGLTWVNLSHPASSINNIYFFNAGNGLICGWKEIFRTTDGGYQWSLRYTASADLNAMDFPDNLHGYTVGEFGEFARTTNGGYIWTKQILPVQNTFFDLSFPAPDTGWIVGRNGTILHTTNGGLVYIEELSVNNFPNPFIGSTWIEYEIRKECNVKVEIMDQAGRIIEIPEEGMKSPGTYRVNWDAKRFDEGIYFCRLTAGSRSSFTKLILMK